MSEKLVRTNVVVDSKAYELDVPVDILKRPCGGCIRVFHNLEDAWHHPDCALAAYVRERYQEASGFTMTSVAHAIDLDPFGEKTGRLDLIATTKADAPKRHPRKLR